MAPAQTAVLFDLDGVLVDSRAPITGCMNAALTDHGLPGRPPDRLERFIGPPLGLAFAEMTGQERDSPLVASCIAAYRRRYATASLRETVVVPGMASAVAEMAEDHRLAVATSKPVEFAEPLLETLGVRDHFAAVCGPNLSLEGESKAITIAAALAALGSPIAVVMVGDRSFDVVGAHACGIPAIGVAWGIGDRAELEASGADVIVQAPGDLPAAVERLLGCEETALRAGRQRSARARHRSAHE